MESRKNISTAVVSCSRPNTRSNKKILQIKIILWTFNIQKNWISRIQELDKFSKFKKFKEISRSTIIPNQLLSKFNGTKLFKEKKTTLKNTSRHVFLKTWFNDQVIKNLIPSLAFERQTRAVQKQSKAIQIVSCPPLTRTDPFREENLCGAIDRV